MRTFREQLELSDMNHRVAAGNKQHVLVHMHPSHFLALTTTPEHGEDYFKSKALPLEKYNEYVRSGETLNSPFLTVDGKGKVVGHEGRHRAGALLNAGHDSMPVHIRLRGDNHPDVPDRDLGWEHMPDRLRSQYGTGGTVHKNQMTLIKDKVAKS